MAAPKCPAALDSLVLTDGIECVATFDRATMTIIHHAGGIAHDEALHGGFHLAERLSVDDPNIRAHHAKWTLYVRASGRVSVAVLVRPGSKVVKSINRLLKQILKKAEADLGPVRTASALVLVDESGATDCT